VNSEIADSVDWRDTLDLRLPINPLGPAPGVRPAIERALDCIVRYPGRLSRRLRERLAVEWSVEPDQILLGNGSTELIYFLSRVWMREVSIVAIPTRPEYSQAHRHAKQVDWHSFEVWPSQGLLMVSHPNSITGLALSFERVRKFLLSTRNPVLIDECLIEFTNQPSVLTFLNERPNLFVLRSMSNFYALPGLRVGALVGDAAGIASLVEQREPWQINILAEAAALAALDDKEHAARSKELVAQERAWLWSQLRRVPSISPIRGETAFVLVHLASGAAEVCEWFRRRNVLIENCTGWPGIDGDAIRIAIRTRPENERAVTLLREYICG